MIYKQLTFLSWCFCTLVLIGCRKDELPKPMYGSPSANTVQVTMGSDYGDQLFFSLTSGTVVAQNHRENWDLAFECGENNRHIRLNSSHFMAMSVTESMNLDEVNNQTAVNWRYDNAAGKEDSTAFYNWEINRVYIVDRGSSVSGQPLGKMKIQVVSVTATGYEMRFAALNDAGYSTVTIPKDSAYNYSFFSFVTGNTVAIEPPKDQWDLCFTTYTNVFPDGTPYLVTGVLTNGYITRAFESTQAFEDIQYATAAALTFSTDQDVIGYDWKAYNFDLGTYVTQSGKVYILKSVDARYYKLRFLDFYDASGEKGAPSFELQELVP